ncbi:Crp/Fnr family transcriptional regulator [Saprospiraceae bacterium]|nr:Crp/Fnr family transcriptional regulator [Saprospiraceae bacterium]
MKLQTSLLQVNELPKINNCFLFSSLTDHQVKELDKYCVEKTFSKGDHIYSEGSKAEYIFFVVSGSVKVYTSTFEGKEVIKNIVHSENILGEQAYAGTNVRLDSAKALDNIVTVVCIHVDDLRGLLQRFWELNEKFISLITKKLSRTETRVKSLIVDDARKRVIDFLKYNAKHKGRKIGFELLVKHFMTQQDIANYTGTSRQTVTSILNDLKKTNMIYFKRNSILIRDIANLA